MLTTALTALIPICNLFQASPAEPKVIGLNPSMSVALSQPYASSFTAQQVSNTNTAMLHPGGMFTGLDGVTVAAPGDALQSPVQVSVERVDERDVQPPLPDGMIAVSGYYRVRTSADVFGGRDLFSIGFPVLAGVSPVGLRVAVLIPAGYSSWHYQKDFWDAGEINQNPLVKTIGIDFRTLLQRGITFILVRNRYGSQLASGGLARQQTGETGTLVPGGNFTSVNGVTITAPENAIRSPIQVFARKIDPFSVSVSVPSNLTTIAMFRIGATPSIGAYPGSFEIELPIPEGISTNSLLIIALILDEQSPDLSLNWFPYGGNVNEAKKTISTRDGSLNDTIYAIVRQVNHKFASRTVFSRLGSTVRDKVFASGSSFEL